MEYLSDKSIKKTDSIERWKKYLNEDNQDVLFLGIIKE